MSRIFRPITETKYGILYLKTIFFYTESEMSPISETSTNDHESSEEEESWTDAKDEQYKDRMVADDKAGFSEGNVYNGKTCKTFLLTVGFKIFDCENSPAVYEMSMITDFSVCAHFWCSLGKDVVFTSDQMRRNIIKLN